MAEVGGISSTEAAGLNGVGVLSVQGCPLVLDNLTQNQKQSRNKIKKLHLYETSYSTPV